MLKILLMLLLSCCCVSMTFAQAEVTPVYVVSYEADAMVFYRYNGEVLVEVERFEGFGQGQEGEAERLVLNYESLALSPDQSTIAFTAHQTETAALFLYNLADGSLQEQPIVSRWLIPLWSPDSSAVFLKVNTVNFVPPDELPHGFIYEIAAGTLTEIYPQPTRELMQWLPDSSGILYRGACLADDCASDNEFWTISRDGSTNIPAAIPSPTQAFTAYDAPLVTEDHLICHLTWSPFDAQWYYEYGCAALNELPHDAMISSGGGLVLDLAQFQLNPVERFSTYRDLVDIVPAPDALYAVVQSDFNLAETYRGSWRILRVQAQPGIELAFESHQMGDYLNFASLSPDNRQIALFSEYGIWVIDLTTRSAITHTSLIEMSHAANWYDAQTLLYDTEVTSAWGEVWRFDLDSGENTLLIGDHDHPAWLINASDLSS